MIRRIEATFTSRRLPSFTLSNRPSLSIALTVVRPKPRARIVSVTDVVSCSIALPFNRQRVPADEDTLQRSTRTSRPIKSESLRISPKWDLLRELRPRHRGPFLEAGY